MCGHAVIFGDERVFAAINCGIRSHPTLYKSISTFPGTFHLVMNVLTSIIGKWGGLLFDDALDYLNLDVCKKINS